MIGEIDELNALQKFQRLQRLTSTRLNEAPRSLENKISIIDRSLEENNFSLNELRALEISDLLNGPQHRELKDLAVERWFWKTGNNTSFEVLKELTEPLADRAKASCYLGWILKAGNNIEEFSQIEPMLQHLFNQTGELPLFAQQIADKWFEKNGNAELREFLALIPFIFEVGRDQIVATYFHNNEEKIDNVAKLFSLIEWGGLEIIDDWFEARYDAGGTKVRKEEIEALPDSIFKDLLLAEWISWDDNNVTLEYIKNLSGQKFASFTAWIGRDENHIEFGELRDICVQMDNKEVSCNILANWLAKQGDEDHVYNIGFKEFKEFIEPLKEHTSDDDFYNVVRIWILKNGINLGAYQQLLLLFKNKDEELQAKILEEIIEKFTGTLKIADQTFEEKRDRLIQLIHEGIISPYDTESMALFCELTKFSALDITKLCKELYPNSDFLQIHLFINSVTQGLIKQENDKEVIKNFLGGIKDVNHCSEFLVALGAALGKELERGYMLDLCVGRKNIQYKHIESLLEGKTVADALNRAAIDVVKNVFGDQVESYQIVDLFSYFDIVEKRSVNILFGGLKPGFIDVIKEKYKSSDPSIYLSEREYKFLAKLLKDTLPTMKPVSIICDYLSEKVPEVLELSAEQIATYQIFKDDQAQKQTALDKQFRDLLSKNLTSQDSSEVLDVLVKTTGKPIPEWEKPDGQDHANYLNLFKEKKYKFAALFQIFADDPSQQKIILNEQFRDLLTRDLTNEDASEITDFFIRISGREIEEGHKINDSDKIKFLELFKDKKYKFAALFQLDGALERFSEALFSVGDGCIFNLSAQAQRAYVSGMLGDSADGLLYTFFLENISTPILNTGIDLLMENRDSDELRNKNIQKHVFSPANLLTKLQAQIVNMCYDDRVKEPLAAGEKRDDSDHFRQGDGPLSISKIIEHEIRQFCKIKTVVDDVKGKIMEDHDLTAKIAAYIILNPIKDLVTDIADHPVEMGLFEYLGLREFRDARIAFDTHINPGKFTAKGLAEFVNHNPEPHVIWNIIKDEISQICRDDKMDNEQNSKLVTNMMKALQESLKPEQDLKSKDIALYLMLKNSPDLEENKLEIAGISEKAKAIGGLLHDAYEQTKSMQLDERVGALVAGERPPNAANIWLIDALEAKSEERFNS